LSRKPLPQIIMKPWVIDPASEKPIKRQN